MTTEGTFDVPEEDVFRLIDVAYRYYFREETLAEIGASYGVTRERVRQWLTVLPKSLRGTQGRTAVYWGATRLRLLDTIIARLNDGVVCVVCGCWVIRRVGSKPVESMRSPTCSPGCASAVQAARPRVSDYEYDIHRVRQARSYLRHPDGKRPSQIAWAKAMLSDDPPPPNRRYTVPGSKATEALHRVGVSA